MKTYLLLDKDNKPVGKEILPIGQALILSHKHNRIWNKQVSQ